MFQKIIKKKYGKVVLAYVFIPFAMKPLNKIKIRPKLTDQARTALIREAIKRPKITPKELQSSTAEIGVSVHRTTLSCTLHRAGLYGKVARKNIA